MGRPYRTALGGYVYHMLNRGNGRLRIFHKDGDYEAFERVLGERKKRCQDPLILTASRVTARLSGHGKTLSHRLAAPRR